MALLRLSSFRPALIPSGVHRIEQGQPLDARLNLGGRVLSSSGDPPVISRSSSA
ncbi:MAG: hypothetical protein JXB07_12725 [Anaerolineae bacterium]|nr:hypothetical protein [Anaerolineae bacterium]